jgi:L-alanine-DL-glutamate epimerase-like enolase superfamily enzyme
VKITTLETIPLRLPLTRPLGNATATIDAFSCLAIYLGSDEGLVGENLIFTIRSEQLHMLDSMVHVLRDAVIGRDVDDTEAFWSEAWRRINFVGFAGVSIMGISAIDGAMWDLRGKAVGKSISRLLGRSRETVAAYASGGLWLDQDIPALVAEAEGFAAQGFRAMKLRLSGRAEVDIPRVAAVRTAIGLGVGLMVDANQALDVDSTLRLARLLEPYDIAWFEEPIPAHDLEGLARIAARITMPIASGENEYTRFGFRRMLELRAASVLMPDLQRVGGVSEFYKAGCLAHAYDTKVSSHLFPEMSLQLLGSLPNASYLEHLGWFQPLYQEKLDLQPDGTVVVPDRPGSGFRFDPSAIAHFRI